MKNSSYNISGTIVAELPTPKAVMESFLECKDLTIPVGVALTHKKDQYCKRTGRELASGRTTPQVFKLDYVEKRFADAYTFVFSANVTLTKRIVRVRIGISVKANTADCRLVFADLS